MILAIDIGNTNIVVGLCENDRILHMERMTTNHNSMPLEYAVCIKAVIDMAGRSVGDVGGAVISSVVPSVTGTIKAAVKKLTGAESLIVGPDIKTGLDIVTDDPRQVGSDLIVDAVAGIHEYGAPLIIFDLGTATTISVINEKKQYVGTVIMPGIAVSLNAMVTRTSKLPRIGLDPPKSVVGTNTVDCMKSGILYGAASSMDGMIERIQEENGDMRVVATGGLAGTVVPLCKNKIILDDELLIKGLMLIYNMNKNSTGRCMKYEI